VSVVIVKKANVQKNIANAMPMALNVVKLAIAATAKTVDLFSFSCCCKK
jgi:hypothetical protein